MRSVYFLSLVVAVMICGNAQARVDITVDKNSQTMTVAVDGVTRYIWPVSSGVPQHETPGGTFRAFRMEEDHYSKEWDDAPMPHSIFFTRQGHAIHGTDHVRNLGVPASHGCVRLSRENAATLFALVERQGVLNTSVTLTGSARTAVARGLKPRGGPAIASRSAPLPLAPGQAGPYEPSYRAEYRGAQSYGGYAQNDMPQPRYYGQPTYGNPSYDQGPYRTYYGQPYPQQQPYQPRGNFLFGN
jgi:hypothetical protein